MQRYEPTNEANASWKVEYLLVKASTCFTHTVGFIALFEYQCVHTPNSSIYPCNSQSAISRDVFHINFCPTHVIEDIHIPTSSMQIINLIFVLTSTTLAARDAKPPTGPALPRIPTVALAHERRGIAFNNPNFAQYFAIQGTHATWCYNLAVRRMVQVCSYVAFIT